MVDLFGNKEPIGSPLDTFDLHTPECIAAAAATERARQEWAEKWPNHCAKCGGWGGFSYLGSWDEPPWFDSCGACVDEGVCPRCGTALPDPDEMDDRQETCVCPSCGADFYEPEDGLPEPYDCWGCVPHGEEV